MESPRQSPFRFKLARLKYCLAAALLAAAVPSFASQYYVVVPVPNHKASAGNVMVTLSGYSLPTGVIGRAYPGFDFNSVLQVLGDPNFSSSGVQWSVAGGSLPAGLSLSSSGKLSGNPTAAGTSSFQVMATYKTKAGEQAYQMFIAKLPGNGTLSVTSLTFGSELVGTQTPAQPLSLTNIGGDTLGVTSMTSTGPFSVSSTCPASLAPNQSCTSSVTFTPTAMGAQSGTVNVVTSNGTQVVTLSGTGLAPTFALSTNSVAMPMADVGASTTSIFTISNTGNAPGTPSISATANFSATQCGSIPAGGSCPSTITFTPSTSQTASQTYSGTVTVSGSSAGTQAVSIKGTGASSTALSGNYAANSTPVYSANQQYSLIMQSDCNLVIYKGADVLSNAVWATDTNGKGSSCYLGVQSDGNLIVYGSGGVIEWQASTGGHSAQPTFIELDNSGILHMYLGTPSAPGALLWSS
ncbi:choice-of-anchor D domain-containing protein [Paraburkholderia susongensis]|uniref:Abnormal spindle-like microcephaly-assoc'd, ASPM-SPD-2-Hydin n=1 Tax=Paraburkholderia susongensis TaxID=1515439 RepID=A0A1X7K9D7_9BURK|nr:choice-of-anchor D domain-containing protein [Paraburkholderia susongensis]SMG36970.1 Abnormal spindle-like microcephaly-assoc'd, ASPM-SPD-2-Hydin [Paraburkholderia susongensis]